MDRDEIVEKILSSPYRLSPDQERAVRSKSRYIRVIAGAGAGKTEVLTRRIVYLLLAEGIEPSSIVAFTFTDRAAHSMKSRIYNRVHELNPGMVERLGEMYIGTIHAFSKRILDSHYSYGNYSVLDENQEVAFLMRYGWDLGIDKCEETYSESVRAFLRTANMVWNEMLDMSELEREAPGFYKKLKQYEDLLEMHRLLTFGRMVSIAVQRLMEDPDPVKSIKHLIVDEYQDINKAQEKLISMIGRSSSVFVVGDPRQSIYQWRGSDESFFHSFEARFSEAETVVIRENRRSGRHIVACTNRLADAFRVQYEHMQAARAENGLVALAEHESPEMEAEWIAEQIEHLVRDSGMKYSDIGVLTRSVMASADPLIRELKRRRIPYIVGGKVGLFSRDEAQALGKIFAWFYKKGFWLDYSGNQRRIITGDELLDSTLESWSSTFRYHIPDNAVQRLREIREDLNSSQSSYRDFTSIFQDVLIALGFRKMKYTDPYDAATIANLGGFNRLLTDYEIANRVGGRPPSWQRDLKGLFWYIQGYAALSYEEQQAEEVEKANAVQIMTVHQAKGLEWPVVFLFSAVDGYFPAGKAGRQLNWCGVPRHMFDVKRYEGSIDDEMRLFYVAITRARDALILSYDTDHGKTKRSRFIENMELSVIKEINNGTLPELKISASGSSDRFLAFSASEIVDYLKCPYMYLLINIYGYQRPLSEGIGFGKGIHYSLRIASEYTKKNSAAEPAEAAERALSEFYMPFVSGSTFEKYKKDAEKIIYLYLKEHWEDLKGSSDAEYRIELPVKNAIIAGRIDVISDREVRDYKTLKYSEGYVDVDEAKFQVKLYAAGLKKNRKKVERGSIAFLDSEEIRIVPVDVSNPEISEAVKMAEAAIEGILDGKFAPRQGGHCSTCDVRKICAWGSEQSAP